MGTIRDIEYPTGPEATEAEKCVGEGGHFFVREGGYNPWLKGFYVRCERCAVDAVEEPDEGDNPGAIE